jgi:hypothetical protein
VAAFWLVYAALAVLNGLLTLPCFWTVFAAHDKPPADAAEIGPDAEQGASPFAPLPHEE